MEHAGDAPVALTGIIASYIQPISCEEEEGIVASNQCRTCHITVLRWKRLRWPWTRFERQAALSFITSAEKVDLRREAHSCGVGQKIELALDCGGGQQAPRNREGLVSINSDGSTLAIHKSTYAYN
jgi:hypothetical protein